MEILEMAIMKREIKKEYLDPKFKHYYTYNSKINQK